LGSAVRARIARNHARSGLPEAIARDPLNQQPQASLGQAQLQGPDMPFAKRVGDRKR